MNGFLMKVLDEEEAVVAAGTGGGVAAPGAT